MRNKMVIAATAVLAALAIGCGSGSELSPGGGAAGAAQDGDKAHTPVAVKVGQKISVKSAGLEATYTLSKAEQRSSGDFDTKPQNGVYLLAFLRVDVTKGETFACSCELSLVQADGKVREETIGSFDDRPQFDAASLKAGQHADGWVVFDLPKSQVKKAKVQLKVQELFSGSEYGYWSMS